MIGSGVFWHSKVFRHLDTRNNRDFGGAMIGLVLDEVSGVV